MLNNYPLYVGLILLAGLLGGKLASRFKMPSATGYIILGIILGPSVLNIINKEVVASLRFVNHLALGLLAVSTGSQLHRLLFIKFGRDLFLVAFGDGLVTFGLVSTLVYLVGAPIEIALMLGVLALAVSPTVLTSIIKEYETKGGFTKNLMALLAVENLMCIIIFGIATAIFEGIQTTDTSGLVLVALLVLEISLALIIGGIAGAINVYIIKKKPNNSKYLVFLLGIILVNTGISLAFNLSALLMNMTMGAVIANLINRKFVISSTLERIELPIFVAFLTMAGAKIDIRVIGGLGIIGGAYIIGRLIGKISGTFIASKLTKLNPKYGMNFGFALSPQAGVAIGLSIIAEEKIPQSNGLIAGVLSAAVIVFEIIGPLLVKRSLINTGELKE